MAKTGLSLGTHKKRKNGVANPVQHQNQIIKEILVEFKK